MNDFNVNIKSQDSSMMLSSEKEIRKYKENRRRMMNSFGGHEIYLRAMKLEYDQEMGGLCRIVLSG